MEWNIIEKYNNQMRVEANIEDGVILPEQDKLIVFVRPSDNKPFIGRMVVPGLFNHHSFIFLSEESGDVGVNSDSINGTKWCYLDFEDHDNEVRKEFIERMCSKFKEDANITIVLRNAMNDVLKEYEDNGAPE